LVVADNSLPHRLHGGGCFAGILGSTIRRWGKVPAREKNLRRGIKPREDSIHRLSGVSEPLEWDPLMTDSSPHNTEQNRSLFEATALPFVQSLHNTARRLTRRPEDAGDLVQETYLRAYRTFHNFMPGTNCKAWLFTILYSIFVNQYRKKQREPEAVSIEELEEKFQRMLAAAEWNPNWGLNSKEVGSEVDQALGRLPEAFRAVVLLVDVEEMSYEEASVILNCPVGTVRSRLFRARKLLFVELQPYARKKGYVQQANQ
jgi:RNA polymerase sigma-70 factor, ECF subfamily